jgi:hypothetical protein
MQPTCRATLFFHGRTHRIQTSKAVRRECPGVPHDISKCDQNLRSPLNGKICRATGIVHNGTPHVGDVPHTVHRSTSSHVLHFHGLPHVSFPYTFIRVPLSTSSNYFLLERPTGRLNLRLPGRKRPALMHARLRNLLRIFHTQD